MAKQVPWTKSILDAFIEEAMLSDDEILIMKTRIQGWTVTQQALALNKSTSSVHSMISQLKKKYDMAQLHRPDELPIRKHSLDEIYMDEH